MAARGLGRVRPRGPACQAGGRLRLREAPAAAPAASGSSAAPARPRLVPGRTRAVSGMAAARRARAGGGGAEPGFGRAAEAEPPVPQGLLRLARRSGQLNLAGRGLTHGA